MINIKHLSKKLTSQGAPCMLACGGLLLLSSGISRAEESAPMHEDYDMNGITVIIMIDPEDQQYSRDSKGAYWVDVNTAIYYTEKLSRIPVPKNEWKFRGYQLMEKGPNGPIRTESGSFFFNEPGSYTKSLLASLLFVQTAPSPGSPNQTTDVKVHTPYTDVVFKVVGPPMPDPEGEGSAS